MQVFGRLVMTAFGQRASTLAVFVTCLASTAIAAMFLLMTDIATGFVFCFVVFQGAGYGTTSIVRPVFVAERLGRRNFGIMAGLLAIAFVGGSALSPSLAALIWETAGGYDPVIWFALAMSILGLIALLATMREKPVSLGAAGLGSNPAGDPLDDDQPRVTKQS
jgi:MFS family permease